MNHDDAYDLVALGAAGALSSEEYAALEELLAADPALTAEYEDLQISVSALAEASSEAPRPSLRASVLDAIRDVEQLPVIDQLGSPATAQARVQMTADPVPAQPANPTPVHQVPDSVVSIHHRRWMFPATAAAAVVMLLAGGLLINRFADAPSSDRMSAVLNDDDATTLELSGSLAGLRLIHSPEQGATVLIGTDVDEPDNGMVFQLWALHDDEMVGMATFTPAATGEVAMLIDNPDSDTEFAVTLEPAGGSDQPTSDPIAVSPGLG